MSATAQVSAAHTSAAQASAPQTSALWVAYGDRGVAGSIRHSGADYVVTMAGADAALGTYPSMSVAKGALHAAMRPGSDWPIFRQH